MHRSWASAGWRRSKSRGGAPAALVVGATGRKERETQGSMRAGTGEKIQKKNFYLIYFWSLCFDLKSLATPFTLLFFFFFSFSLLFRSRQTLRLFLSVVNKSGKWVK